MAYTAFAFSEKYFLAAELGISGLVLTKLAEDVQLRRGWEVQNRLEFRHEVNLTSTFENIYSFLGGDDGVAVKICRSLLKLGKVLDAFKRSLRTEQPLDVYASKRRGIYPMTELLRADITY